MPDAIYTKHISDRTVRTEAVYRTSVQALERDTLIDRSLTNRQSLPPSPTTRRGGGIRQTITKLTRSARKRMAVTVGNLPVMPYTLTLTYPANEQPDGQKIKRDLSCMRKWLSRRGIGGFWVLEWTRAGTPHYALLLTRDPGGDAIKSAWHRITGSTNPSHLEHGAKLEPVRDQQAIKNYMVKRANDRQKQPPPSFGYTGRYWGVWGIEIPVRASQTDTRTAAAPTVRFIRNLMNARRRTERNRLPAGTPIPRHLRPFRDNGKTGFVAWGTGQAVSDFLHMTERRQHYPHGIRCFADWVRQSVSAVGFTRFAPKTTP